MNDRRVDVSLTLLHTRELGWPAQARIAAAADELGYHRLWVGETFGTDALAELAVHASSTKTIGLASGVVGIFGRTPATLAQSAVTLDAISGGRFTLGLGTSSSVLATQWHGTPFREPVTRMRETIDVVRLILSGERLNYSGRFFTLEGGLRIPQPSRSGSVPLYVGALAPGGLRLAGELADGWIGTFVSPEHYERVFESAILDGLSVRHESRAALRVCVYQLVVANEDRDVVLAAVRPHLARYVGLMGRPEKNYYARLFREYGFVEEVEFIQRAYGEHNRERAESAITTEMVDSVTISGSTADVREGLAKIAALDIDEIALELLTEHRDAESFLQAMETLAPHSA